VTARDALATVSRIQYQTCATGVRVVLDGQVLGPVMTKRAARIVARWLEGGALAELEGEGQPKIVRTMGHIDRAIDSVTDLLKNGLR
jgi:hypothetical protein